MGGKSSSAPLLENNDAKNVNGKVPVSSSLFNFIKCIGSSVLVAYHVLLLKKKKKKSKFIIDVKYSPRP